MEQHFHEVVASSRVAYTFTDFHMHEFIERSKRKTAEGNCLILEWKAEESASGIFYFKMNNFDFCKKINESTFIRVRYLKSTSYLFFNEFVENLVYAISVMNQSPYLATFDDLLSKNGNLLDYESSSMKYEVKVRIDFHVDQVLENEIIINFNKAAKIGKALGGFFGKINNTITKKAAEAEARYQDELKRVSRESFSDSTRSKWESFVQKVSGLNSKLTQVVKPLNQTISKAVSDVGEKYSNSTNEYVKAVREFAKQTQDSINQGYQSGPEIPKQGGGLPQGEDNSVNMMGQNLILNEQASQASEQSPYPNI